MAMSYQTILIVGGIVFLFIAILGGGVIFQGYSMPQVKNWRGWLIGILGLVLIISGVLLNFFPASGDAARQGHPCRNRQDLPSVTEERRTEDETRKFLEKEGFFEIVAVPVYDSGAPQGIVVGQEPPQGEILCPRDKVTIKVAR